MGTCPDFCCHSQSSKCSMCSQLADDMFINSLPINSHTLILLSRLMQFLKVPKCFFITMISLLEMRLVTTEVSSTFRVAIILLGRISACLIISSHRLYKTQHRHSQRGMSNVLVDSQIYKISAQYSHFNLQRFPILL